MNDDRSKHCIPFILKHVISFRQGYLARSETPPPFFVGINGIQGAGKTTLVNDLRQSLKCSNKPLQILVLSIDDLYLTYHGQNELASHQPHNPLLQHRGQPSTHDVSMGKRLFGQVYRRERNVKVPIYDKSAFQGKGDRLPVSEWPTVNREGEATVDVVIFEAKKAFQSNPEEYRGRLGRHEIDHIRPINEALRGYDVLTDYLQAFIHLDAENTDFVYKWRLEQEAEMRKIKGVGMTEQQVIDFVNGYYPAYELYSDNLRSGVIRGFAGSQLRIILTEDRKVNSTAII